MKENRSSPGTVSPLKARTLPSVLEWAETPMPTLPTADWIATLDRMAAGVDRALSDLDQYQREWAPLVERPAAAAQPELLLAWLERRLTQWDARLTAAGQLAAEVEGQLAERETALGRWHELFVRWRDLIQRAPDTSAGSEGESPCPVASQ